MGSSQKLLVVANVTGRAHHPEHIVRDSRTGKIPKLLFIDMLSIFCLSDESVNP